MTENHVQELSREKLRMAFSFNLIIRTGINGIDRENDNVDVEVHFPSGETYVATFFTLTNIQTLFEKNRITGECKNGLYFQCPDMIIVEELTEDVVRETAQYLLENGEFEHAFLKIEETE
jgi:hypothetical protein